MIISKTDEVRRELLAMTHEIAEQEEQNFRIAECIWGRLVVPHDQPDLQPTGLPGSCIFRPRKLCLSS